MSSPSSLPVLGVAPAAVAPPMEEDTTFALGLEKAVTISVSGATSSGKTTLAIILSCAFSPSSSSIAPFPVVLHQDNFFFHKGACETASFPSKKEDTAFCQSSLARNDCTTDGFGYMIASQATGSGGIYTIAGPDTDALSAINFWGLLKVVVEVKKEGGVPLFGGVGRVPPEQVVAVKEKYAKLINRAKQLITSWTKAQSAANKSINFPGLIVKQSSSSPSSKPFISPKLLFLEGFLLYDQTSNLTQNSKPKNGDDRTKQKHEEEQAHHLLTALETKFHHGHDYTDVEIDFIQEHHLAAMKRAMSLLQPLLDIKLFLTTSMQAAKTRRQSRVEYVDYPSGQRLPGQMWKTEGYFEHVAWRNHVLQHSWLVDYKGVPLKSVVEGGGEVAGVIVREEVDAGVENTVKWALENILIKLAAMEERARLAFLMKKSNLTGDDSEDDESVSVNSVPVESFLADFIPPSPAAASSIPTNSVPANSVPANAVPAEFVSDKSKES